MLVLKKKRFILRILISALAVAVLACMSINANAALIKSYDFNGDFSDTLGNGFDLTPSGGTVSGGRYSFSDNQGLRLTSALPSTTDYAIELSFQMNDSLSGYNKLIDFQDLVSDNGQYVFRGELSFYDIGPTGGSVLLNTDFTVGLARSAGSIELFLNGTLLGIKADFSGQAVPGSNILNFFEDDTITGQSESFVGSVDFIRIHDDSSTFGTAPVPEPATLMAMPWIPLLLLGD
jgi:hypothetical protein